MKIRMITKSGRLPSYETKGSAGMDICAFLEAPVTLEPGQRALIPTGLFAEIPDGYEAQLRARSGLSIRCGITLVNGIGTIDSDYRGEIQAALINLGQDPFTIHDGDRIAQMVICPVQQVCVEAVPVITDTERGSGGFGSTGI